MGNWESENDSFSIPFMIPLLPIPVPIPPKYPTELESRFLGMGIVPPLILGNDPIAFDTAKGRHGMGHTVAGRMRHRRHVAEIEEATTAFGQM